MAHSPLHLKMTIPCFLKLHDNLCVYKITLKHSYTDGHLRSISSLLRLITPLIMGEQIMSLMDQFLLPMDMC